MGGHRQKKSSNSGGFFSVFNIFTSKKPRGGYSDGYDYGRRVWPSDDDNCNWGVAEPNIDMKADVFIRQYKQRFTESARYQVDPAAAQNA